MGLREVGWGGMDWIHLSQVGAGGGTVAENLLASQEVVSQSVSQSVTVSLSALFGKSFKASFVVRFVCKNVT